MTRVRMYSAPHKGLRLALSNFSTLAGKLEFSDPESLKQLKNTGRELFDMLSGHTITENEYVLKALATKVPEAAAFDIHEHEELEEKQTKLEERMNALTGFESSDEQHEFYLLISDFHSTYLSHILHEEQVSERLMQHHFTDEELVAIRADFIKAMDFNKLLLFMKHIAAAQTLTENMHQLNGMKANMPPEAFEAVCGALKQVLPAQEFNTLMIRTGLFSQSNSSFIQ